MNGAMYMIVVPAVLVSAGYVIVLRMMGMSPGYVRLLVAGGLFAGMIYWLSKRGNKRSSANRDMP